MLLSDYILQVQELVHDNAGIDYTTPELTQFINNARKRVALDFHCVRNFYTNLQTVVGQETYPISGGIGGATVLSGGAYTPPTVPTVTFDPPAGTLGGYSATATGTAIMNAAGTAVTGIAMTSWGAGYTTGPNITFAPSGATALAVPLLNVLDIQSISVIFGTQRTMLLWHPFTYHQAVFRMNTALTTGQPTAYSNFTEANLWYVYPPLPDQNYPLEMDAVVTPNLLVNPTDADFQILDPMADCVQFYASHLALLKMQNFEQAEYFHKKYKARQMEVQMTRQTRRLVNPYQNLWRRLQRGF
jgi:hypothetical protein